MKPLEQRDYSGVTLDLTNQPISKRFAPLVLLLPMPS